MTYLSPTWLGSHSTGIALALTVLPFAVLVYGSITCFRMRNSHPRFAAASYLLGISALVVLVTAGFLHLDAGASDLAGASMVATGTVTFFATAIAFALLYLAENLFKKFVSLGLMHGAISLWVVVAELAGAHYGYSDLSVLAALQVALIWLAYSFAALCLATGIAVGIFDQLERRRSGALVSETVGYHITTGGR